VDICIGRHIYLVVLRTESWRRKVGFGVGLSIGALVPQNYRARPRSGDGGGADGTGYRRPSLVRPNLSITCLVPQIYRRASIVGVASSPSIPHISIHTVCVRVAVEIAVHSYRIRVQDILSVQNVIYASVACHTCDVTCSYRIDILDAYRRP
jgi:hypothetical protein